MAEKYAYIARCRKCNGIVMATVDNPRHREVVAETVAEYIGNDYFIERVVSTSVMKEFENTCMCEVEERE